MRKRSWSVPAVGLGALALFGGAGAVGLSRSAPCEDSRVVATEADCTAFLGAASQPKCIAAFAAATERQADADRRAVFARRLRGGATDAFAVLRDATGGTQWRKLDGSVADRVYRSCSRRASNSYSRTVRSWSPGFTSTPTATTPRATTPRATTVGRGGFGSSFGRISAST